MHFFALPKIQLPTNPPFNIHHRTEYIKMTHHPQTNNAASPPSPFQGVDDDRELHREIATADLFYDSAHTAPAKSFSKPSPSAKSASSFPPDKITRLMDEAPAGELGDAEDCETCLSCKKAKRAAESWTELDEFTCACEDAGMEGGGVSNGMYYLVLGTFATALWC